MLRQTLLYLPAQFLGPLAMFVAAVVWTHLLDAGTYGIVSYVLAAQELIYLLTIAFWSYFALRYRGSLGDGRRQRLIEADNTVVLVGALVQVVVALPLMAALETTTTPGLYMAATVLFVTRSLLTHYSEIARSEEAIFTYTVAQLAGPIAGTLASFAGVTMFGSSATAALTGIAIAQTLGLAYALVRLRIAPRFHLPDRAILREAIVYGVPVIFAGQLGWVSTNGIRVIVERLAGAEALGLLSVGWGLGLRVASVAAMLLTAAAFPAAVRRWESGDRAGALEQLAVNGTMLFGLLAPTVVGVALVATPLVDLMIAPDYRSATIAILPLAVLLGAVRNQTAHHFAQVFLLEASTTRLVPFNALDAVATVIGTGVGLVLGGPGTAGLVGATLGGLGGTLVGATVTAVSAIRGSGLRPQWSAWARIAVASAVMALVLGAIPWGRGPIALVAEIGLGATVYAVVLVASFPEVRQWIRRRLHTARG